LTPPALQDSGNPTLPLQVQNLYVKSIRMGDVDVLNDTLHLTAQPSDPLVIVIGTNLGTVRGRLVDENQRPVAGATVVLVYDNALRYRVNEKVSTTDAAGNVVFDNVPPG